MGAYLWNTLRDNVDPWFQSNRMRRLSLLFLFLLFSVAPDFDAVPGLLLDDLGAWHNQQSHSLLFGMGFTLVCAWLASRKVRPVPFATWFMVFALSWNLHLAMDLVTRGRGLRLFWPFTPDRVPPPAEVFGGYNWSAGLFHPSHLPMLMEESVFAILLIALSWGVRKFRPKRERSPPAVNKL